MSQLVTKKDIALLPDFQQLISKFLRNNRTNKYDRDDSKLP